jgi:hypothetical protein
MQLHGGIIRAYSDDVADSSRRRKGTTYEMEIPCVMIDSTVSRPAAYENIVIKQPSRSVAEEFENHDLHQDVEVQSLFTEASFSPLHFCHVIA